MSRFLDRLKNGLLMTHDEMWHRLSSAVASRRPTEIRDALMEALITSDTGVELTESLLEGLADPDSTWEDTRRILASRIISILRRPETAPVPEGKPRVILLVGVNGSGKTTSAAKLAVLEREKGRTVMLAAADTFRAAAIEQLSVWADRIGVPVFARAAGSDPASVAYDAMTTARSQGIDTLIVDTAGRMHTRSPLMDELAKIERVMKKLDPSAPHATYLVMEATTGQNGIVQAESFLGGVEVDGIILTKLDGTAKGGVVVLIVDRLGLPVRYVGVGEGENDLIPFDPESFADALLRGE